MTASSELGEFLRARRARLQPLDVGLPPGVGLRRTPGLRREELAALAGLSIDYVQNRVNDILAANPEGVALFAGIEEWPIHRCNTVRYVFCHPNARTLYPDWDATALATVANLRARSIDAPNFPDLTALVEEVSAHSAEFTLGFETLNLGGGLRLSLLQADPGTPDHDALKLLAGDPVH